MSKIAYNACYGGFSLSRKAVLLARELSGNPKWGGPCIKGDEADGWVVPEDFGHIENVPRHDPNLIAVIEKLGKDASGFCARLVIKEVPSGTPYRIDVYDGRETVETIDTYDWTIAP